MRLPCLAASPLAPLSWRPPELMASPVRRARALHACATPTRAWDDGPLAVAPMMDYTDRFLRYLLRLLSSRATLYTEMVTANTLVHCGEHELPRFLAHDGAGHSRPVVLQLGGANPEMLRKAMEVAEPWGYTAYNLNVGCPSDRVAGSGCFGAALMRDPSLVADCCAAMSDGVGGRSPITVKCRIGVTSDKANAAVIDDEPTYDELCRFVDTVSSRGGVEAFVLHARKAVLGGLSPAQNRQIPPLRYSLVRRLASDFPSLRFSLNGGIDTLSQAATHLDEPDNRLSGVMVGRAVIARPWAWSTIDTALYGEATNPAHSRRQVMEEYCDFADRMQATDPHKIRRLLISPALNLFAGEPQGKAFRRTVDQIATSDASLPASDVLRRAAAEALLAETLDAPPGSQYHWATRSYTAADAHAVGEEEEEEDAVRAAGGR